MQPPYEPPGYLPSVRLLSWLSLCALLLAAFIAVAVVLPAETDRDPTGLGRVFGLAEMGRIKVALANEAAADAKAGDARPNVGERRPTTVPGSRWRDSMSITLQPSEGIEVKMSMRTAEKARYPRTTQPIGTVRARLLPSRASWWPRSMACMDGSGAIARICRLRLRCKPLVSISYSRSSSR